METRKETVKNIYKALKRHFGLTHWWPGDTPFEIALGAILTQNTAWANVEKALDNMKAKDWLSPEALTEAASEEVEEALRPSGYFRQKTERVRLFCSHLLTHYQGSMKKLGERPLKELREELLSLKGIGPETADDILLYACHKKIFVVDAYTKRIFSRCGLVSEKIAYHPLQALIEKNFAGTVKDYQEFHGLIVWTAKDFCRKTPACRGCPLALPEQRGQAFPCHRSAIPWDG
ncbi:MAG TPA: endonuclease III domain-containing protein [Candidatus Hydrogenedentes bacterium]|mgnify:CR=1 FL=1|jgi:endonuclease-3 related protein|nr:endonuclease III domain-containing protein [Candidatus Hydrogenedentota bacterium]HOD96110.1 endonuclease III domain-containing protein [Candidatus Hydrogenedentota bacterium]HOH43220.1 endonuclease III domain-containing protein [Candidatus Hydrogenedentota bacterium]HOM47091.1 endonuclease III domain-containing protein [Candidatus Hydrogenedentota bacterium]HOR50934.1 endonuclease III domain-containing protein [Candidatus Hydrogenedentota bacterium]